MTGNYQYKKAKLIVDDTQYLYIVKPFAYWIKITVYFSTDKVPWFSCFFSYANAWGFDVYRPKTIEILVRYYKENHGEFSEKEFYLQDCHGLFQKLFDDLMSDCQQEQKQWFLEICNQYGKAPGYGPSAR